MKQLWILVGGNGAGKTTFYQQALEPHNIPFINADIIAKEYYPEAPAENSRKAAKLAEILREEQLQTGNSFCYETVFSHPSKIDFIARAKALNYHVIMVFIHVSSSDLNKARVSQRVIDGGHHVPEDKIETRIPRTLNNVKQAILLCDDVRILDNSRLENPFSEVMSITKGIKTSHISPEPQWLALLFD